MTADDRAPLKLLIVDDEPHNLALLYRSFRREFSVFQANSGIEALKLLDEQGEMAIIISDQRMPQMTGTDFLSRTVEPFPDTLRILLTAYADSVDLVEAINTGKVFKYITKPWEPDKLKAIVQQAAETYQLVKQRTQILSRALQRESLLNTIMKAVRSSLDYTSMLQTVVETLSRALNAGCAILAAEDLHLTLPDSRPDARRFIYCHSEADRAWLATITLATVEPLPVSDIVLVPMTVQDRTRICLSVPFTRQGQRLARLHLFQQETQPPWSEETIELLRSVTDQVTLAISQARLYQQIQQQTTQMRAELEVARQIQHNLLHQHWPEIPGIKIQARCQPAREIGGDFFEVFVHPQGDVWLAVGDVAGKGVPAALFMASAISVLRRELAQETAPRPEQVMHNLNQSLSTDLVSNNCFITLVLVRYRHASRELVYANAGHVYPLVWSQTALLDPQLAPQSRAAVQPTYLETRGVPLGILPDWQAAAGTLSLSPGDVVLLISDGITEASTHGAAAVGGDRSQSTMLKQEGLWQLLKTQASVLDLDQVLAHIHPPDGAREDDQTLLSLEVSESA
jgi:serine phosphatase RsbU (regulator of sigma subunit)/CheY-like chemotaxis protein